MVSIRTRFDLIGLSVMYMFIDLASAQGLYYLMVVVLDHDEMSAIEYITSRQRLPRATDTIDISDNDITNET